MPALAPSGGTMCSEKRSLLLGKNKRAEKADLFFIIHLKNLHFCISLVTAWASSLKGAKFQTNSLVYGFVHMLMIE